MKMYNIYLDGIDKCGKDSILPYIGPLSNYKYICNVRGVISQIAYSKLYNRPYEYDLDQQIYALNVYLTVDYEDWKIRCKSTNEPEINYIENVKVFDESFDYLKKLHFPVLKCNTSKCSPYEIAKIIINEIERYNKGYEVST